MKKKVTRVTTTVLALLFLCPMLAMFGQLNVSATDNGKRFIFSELTSNGDSVYQVSNDHCPTLQLSAIDTVFTATGLFPMGSNGSTNALYISFDLSENANVNGVLVQYTYTQNNSSVTTKAQRKWTDGGTEHAFVLHTPHVSLGLTALSITFLCDGNPQGSVTVRSFFDVSVYTSDASETDETASATVKQCVYNKETNTVDITVQLSHEASVYYAGQTLELFALAPKENPYLSNKTYVARAGVSLNDIHFSVEVNGAEEIYSRYVIAAVNKEGMREPLCAPIYPDIMTDNTKQTHGFKGFHTDSLFSVIDSGADVEIIDVYLDRLESEQGILYAGAHSYYHFDQSYIDELDRRVRNLTGAGCGVYLRFLISPDANDYSFVEGSATNIVHKGLVIDNEQALLDIHAYTDFLTSRYTGDGQGKIVGIVIGRQADRSSTYGYVGSKSLPEYAELYATALNLIAGVGRNHISDLQIVVPVSDRTWPETISAENLNGDYFGELFLISLLEVLKAQTLTPPEFSVMLESATLPNAMTRQTDPKQFYGMDDLSAFLSLIEEYSRYYGFMDANILYSWMPDASLDDEALCAAYALQYIALTMNSRVRSFFADFSLIENGGETGKAKDLLYVATYIDTDQSETVMAPILNTLGISSFNQLFPNFSYAVLKTSSIVRVSLSKNGYLDGKAPVGSYELWNFSGATGLLDWYAGNSCEDLSVLNRALTARFAQGKDAEYADVAYHFAEPKNLSKAPLMRFSIGLEGAQDMPYEVQIRLLGERVTVISSTVMTHGETVDLYLDLTAYAANLADITSIRVLARPLNAGTDTYSLRLYRVTLESMQLSSEELAALMSDNAADQDLNNREDEKKDYTTPILVTVLVAVASLSLAAYVIIRYRVRRVQNEKTARMDFAGDKK